MNGLLNSKKLSKNALFVYWIVMFSATHYPGIDRLKPEGGWPIPSFELVMHTTVYVLWTVMWWWTLRAHGYRFVGGTVAWVTAGGIAYSAFDELTQAIVDRTPSIADFTYNVAGILIATLVLQAIDRWVLKSQPGGA
jgi:VanZ family protein